MGSVRSKLRPGTVAALLAALILTSLTGWLVFRIASRDDPAPPQLAPETALVRPSTETRSPAAPSPGQGEVPQLSERQEASAPTSNASPRGLHKAVTLHVVDADSDAELSDVSVRVLSTAVMQKRNELRDMDSGWILSPSLREQPGAHITSLPVVASGSSPLTCPTALGRELWITARGYGWARLSLFEAWPDRITIRLQRGADLEVAVPGYRDYSQLFMTLSPKAAAGKRPDAPIRRTALDGIVQFSGLSGGEYSIEVTGVQVAHDEIDRMSRTITLHDREQRRLVLTLEKQWGSLVLRLTEPIDEQGERALHSVCIQSLEPEVLPRDRTKIVDDFVVEGVASSTTETPLRLPIGRTLIIVRPHGVQYEIDVLPDSVVELDRILPRVHKRRITFWDSRLDKGWTGMLRAFRDAPLVEGITNYPITTASFDPATGRVEAYWPAVPFYFALDFRAERLDPELMKFESGAAIPADLRLELDSIEDDAAIELGGEWIRLNR